MLKHVLVAALIVGGTTPLAQADLILGQPIDIVGTNDLGGQWGTGVLGGVPHPFGGGSFYLDDILTTDIVVDSTELPPPAAKKFAGEFRTIYTTQYLSAFSFESIDIAGIKEPGLDNFINTVGSTDQFGNPLGLAVTDGFNITFSASTADILLGGGSVRIQWTQSVIPAPGSLALLGLAGLCGTRRRRR
ncbi:MAG: PEP-CTERM sorting domain-containing protein [Planctomycetota bacterium]|jgi:hypothetical protein